MASTDPSHLPTGSNLSVTSTTSFSRFVLRVEATDILMDWADRARLAISHLRVLQALWLRMWSLLDM